MRSKCISGLLNSLFVGGLLVNTLGHCIRLLGNEDLGMRMIGSGYISLLIGFSLICLRSYRRTGKLSRRYWPWLLVFILSPPFFIVMRTLF